MIFKYRMRGRLTGFGRRTVATFGVALGLLLSYPQAAMADEPEEFGSLDLTQLVNIRIITATRRSTPLRKAPAIATIVTADEIRNMGARNLLDVLKMVPGFGISISVFGLPMVEVRGIRTTGSEKILIMIDGHSLNTNLAGSAFFNYADLLPVENIKQVEVLRGPASALYGNSAFVATINVITRDAEEINGLEMKGGAGSFDAYKANLVGGKAFGDKLTVSASFDHSQANSPDVTVGADALSGTPVSRAPGTPGLSYHQDAAFLKVGYDDLSFRGGYSQTHRDSFIGFGYALTDNNYNDSENYWGELAYAHIIADGLTANWKLRYDHFWGAPNIKLFPNGYSPAPGVVFPNGMIDQPIVQDRNLGSELQVDWDAFKGNHLIGGISFDAMTQYGVSRRANFDPITGAPLPTIQEVANWQKEVTREMFAFYLQDEWQFTERLNLTTGVRYDHYSDFGDTVNPRVGLVWGFLENADLKLLYGRAFRAPNFQELYNINNPVLGNPNLKPEILSTYEAGVGYRLNRNFAASLIYFYSVIDDLINLNSTVSPATTYANIGKAVTQGVGLELNGAFGAHLSWKAFYTYKATRDGNTGQPLPNVPSQRASGSVNYALTKYVNLHTDVLWTGVRPRVQGDTRPEMPSYTTVDLAVTAKNFWKGLEVQLAVHNLFNEHYSDPDSSGAAKLVPGDFPREGISMFANVLYKF